MTPGALLALITLLAAVVNGALGYGFSSITVPLALLFLANRVLNPALVLIEVPLNAYVLWVNRGELGGVWRRVFPMIIGLVPGVLAGTMMVSNSGQGSKIVRSGTVVRPLDDWTVPRVVPTIIISYSHSPPLSTLTSANASFGPAMSSS